MLNIISFIHLFNLINYYASSPSGRGNKSMNPMMHTSWELIARMFKDKIRWRGSEKGHDQSRSCKARQASKERK